MQEEILDKNPRADLQVYAIWFNMLPSDDRSSWDNGLLTDARVVHLWDEGRIVGQWYAEQGDNHFGPIAWDIYYVYGPEAEWDLSPEPLLSSGTTIIAKRSDLQAAILPLLED